MNSTTFLILAGVVLVIIVASTVSAGFYSYFRLDIDQRLAAAKFNHVAVVLTRRQEIAGEMLEAVRDRLADSRSTADISGAESALAAAGQALSRIDGLPTESEAARISRAETGLLEAINAFADSAEASRNMSGDISYENRMREWQRTNQALQPAVAAYNESVQNYQRRRALLWVRPFAKIFDYVPRGRLRLPGLGTA